MSRLLIKNGKPVIGGGKLVTVPSNGDTSGCGCCEARCFTSDSITVAVSGISVTSFCVPFQGTYAYSQGIVAPSGSYTLAKTSTTAYGSTWSGTFSAKNINYFTGDGSEVTVVDRDNDKYSCSGSADAVANEFTINVGCFIEDGQPSLTVDIFGGNSSDSNIGKQGSYWFSGTNYIPDGDSGCTYAPPNTAIQNGFTPAYYKLTSPDYNNGAYQQCNEQYNNDDPDPSPVGTGGSVVISAD